MRLWDGQEAFGAIRANENQDSDAIAFSFRQRFTGQYLDEEPVVVVDHPCRQRL